MPVRRKKYKKISLAQRAIIFDFMHRTQGSYTIRGWAEELNVTIHVIRNLILRNNFNYIRKHVTEERKNKLIEFIRSNPEKSKSELAHILDISFFRIASMCRRYSLITRPSNPDLKERARRRAYFLAHPHETRKEIARGLGLSVPTIVMEIRKHHFPHSKRSTREPGMERVTIDNARTTQPEKSPMNALLTRGW